MVNKMGVMFALHKLTSEAYSLENAKGVNLNERLKALDQRIKETQVQLN